ncbi:MAG: thioredoxin family protein [Saprospiraceae bacterium]|nr:thioredoxin family protein [Saprospiraceae bacterium]
MNIKLLIFSLLTLSFSSLFAQEVDYKGVDFEEDGYQAALKSAKESKKIVFIDAFTTWCGPCKKLKREIFPDSNVGNFFNTHFLNLEINMEKGEGVALAKAFNVKAYPTLLFVDDQGKLLHRATGFHTVEELLELGKAAIDPNRQLVSLENRFKNGEKNPDFLYQYAQVRFDLADDSYENVAETYLETQPNWGEEKNLRFIFKFLNNLDSKSFDFFLKNKNRFEEKFGFDQVENKIQDLVLKKIETNHDTLLTGIDKIYTKIYPDAHEKMSDKFKIKYFRENEKTAQFVESASNYFSKNDASASELNDAAYYIFDSSDEKKLLKKGLKWAEQSVKKEKSLQNMDVLIGLNYKLGKKSKALKYTKEAVEIGRKSGENYDFILAWFDKINKM